MKKTYITPLVETYMVNLKLFLNNSNVTIGESIYDTNEYIFLGREEKSDTNDYNVWDSGW